LSASLNPALLAVIIPVLSVLTMLSLLPAVEILITSYVNTPSAVSSLSPAVLTTAPVLSRGSKGSTPVVSSKSTPIRSLCSIAPPLSATVSNDTAVAVAVVFSSALPITVQAPICCISAKLIPLFLIPTQPSVI
jgi:hypothetical protein